VCFDRGGAIEYDVNVPTAGHYALQIDVRQYNRMSALRLFDLSLSVDEIAAGRMNVLAPRSAVFFLPYLEAGNHPMRIAWHNPVGNSTLAIDAVRLVSYGGADANGNGTADWVDARQAGGVAVAQTGDSYTSPLCLEGTSWGSELLDVTASYAPEGVEQQIAVRHGAGDRWFSNVWLSPTNPTAIAVTGNGGTCSWSTSVTWRAFNVMDPAMTNGICVRKGDALLLTAQPEGVTEGAITLSIWQGAAVMTNIATTVGHPVPYVFDRAGEYNVYAAYSGASVATNAMVAVKSVGASFGGAAICVVGRSRQWECPGVPSENVAIEHDASVNLTVTPRPQGGVNLQLLADTVGTSHVVARLAEAGPVLDSADVDVLRFDTTAYGRVGIIATFPDGSQMVEISIWFSDVPSDLRILMGIFVGGVLFDDGTIYREVTAADFNEYGEYRYRLLRGPNVRSSTCHWVRTYDGSELIAF
jgi:hypothetical protein